LGPVHTPWVPEGSPLKRAAQNAETEAKFKQVLAEYDKQVGRLMQGLKESGLDQNTIVIFTSDNGPAPAFGQRRTAGLRGRKASLYEGGTRMPFIVRWPGQTPAGRLDEHSVLNSVDLVPTFCKLAKAPLPPTEKWDGEDVSDAFLGKPVTRKTSMFWEYGRNPTAYSYPNDRNRSPSIAVREGKWKLLLNADGANVELYNLEADLKESRNVAPEETVLAKRLSEAALAWKRSLP
jgi:arylsulfatase A-like enzyme